MAALFARLQAGPLSTLIVTFSRAYKLPTEVQSEQQPALFLVTTEYDMFNPESTRVAKQRGHPTTQTIRCNVIVYATQTPGDENPEGNLLNPIVDAVEETLKFVRGTDRADPQNTVDTNLGGLVERVTFSEEPIALITGTGTQQATILIPIEMLISQGP